MTAISAVRPPQDGEHFNLGTTTMRILEDGRTTDQRSGFAVSTLAPQTDGPPQHLHTHHDQGSYVVSGIAQFGSGEEMYEAPAGALVMVPPGAPHCLSNPGDEPMVMAMVMVSNFTPAHHVDYFREVAAMFEAGQQLTPVVMADLMDRYPTQPAASPAAGSLR